MDLRSNRELNNGFGESLSRAFELVVTPAILGFLGYLLDGRTGTGPLFMLAFALVGFGYLAWKNWSEYERKMQSHEEQLGVVRRTASDAPRHHHG